MLATSFSEGSEDLHAQTAMGVPKACRESQQPLTLSTVTVALSDNL